MSYIDDGSDYSGDPAIDDSAGFGNFDNTSASIPTIAVSPGDGGVANASSPLTLPPDASGGNGSFLSGLLPTLTNGVNATINSALLSSLGQNSSLYTVDAYGNLVPKAAAGANNAAYAATVAPSTSPLAGVLSNKTTLFVLGGIALLVLLMAGKK